MGYKEDTVRGKELLFKGEIKPWRNKSDWPKKWRTDANAALLWDRDSEEKLEIISKKAQDIARSYGIEIWRAGVTDGTTPFHTTIVSGDMSDFEDVNDEEIFTKLSRDESLSKILHNFPKISANFDNLFTDGHSVVINATVIPNAISTEREKIAKIMKDFGSKPRPIADIFHITLSRIKNYAENSDLKAYWLQLQTLKKEIEHNPLNLQSEKAILTRDIQSRQRASL
jgi:hypothetical protein